MSTSTDPASLEHGQAAVGRPGERVEHLYVRGLRVCISQRGHSATPLLLIMGLGATYQLWDPLRDALGDRATVAYDNPGVGGSSTPRLPRTMAGLARLLVSTLNRLGYAKVDVLGVSMGGAIAQELAHQAPDRVRKLVLAATLPGWGGVPGRPDAVRILMTPRRYYDQDYLERVAPTLYGGRIRQQPGLLRQQKHARFTRPPSVRGYAYQLFASWGWTSLPWLHRITTPTLVLAGDDDPIVPLTNARILAARIPDARLHVLPGAGHLFVVHSVDRVLPPLLDFLDEPLVAGT